MKKIFQVPANSAQAIPFQRGILATASYGGDYIILPNGSEMRILKRDNSLGLFYSRWVTALACNDAATNGVWFACAAPDGLKLFTFNETTSNYGVLLAYPGTFYWTVQFLSDGSLVAANNVSLVTRVNSGDTWNIVDETIINTGPEILPKGVIMHLTDTRLVYVQNNNNAIFMQRNANYSWTQVDQQPLASFAASLLFNVMWFNDTLIVVYGFSAPQPNSYSSRMQVLVKANNVWNVTLDTTGEGIVEPYGSVGSSLVQLSDTQVLIGAPLDGIVNTSSYVGVGSVLVLERSDTMPWTITALIHNEPRDRLWGASLLKTDAYVLVWSCLVALTTPQEVMCGFSPLPFCLTDPVDVTCSNQQLNSCSDATDINLADLYTIQNSECGATRSTDFSFSNSGLEISFAFTRYGVQVGSCNATLTCPAVNEPTTATQPTSSSVPIADQNSPVSGSSPRSKVSSAFTEGLSLLATFAAVAANVIL